MEQLCVVVEGMVVDVVCVEFLMGKNTGVQTG